MKSSFNAVVRTWIAAATLLALSGNVLCASSDAASCASQVAEALKAADRIALAKQIWGELPDPVDVERSRAYVGEVLHQLGTIRSVKPLPRFPDGLTEKLDVGVAPAANVAYSGYTLLANTDKEGELPVFVSVRNESPTCRLWSLAIHFPAAKKIRAGEVLQAAKKAAGL